MIDFLGAGSVMAYALPAPTTSSGGLEDGGVGQAELANSTSLTNLIERAEDTHARPTVTRSLKVHDVWGKRDQ